MPKRWPNLLPFLITIALCCVFVFGLYLVASSTSSPWADVILKHLTDILIAIFAGTLWWTTLGQVKHFKATERAYVKMSHVEPGITFGDDGSISFQVQIKNWGSTPARVTDAVICLIHTEGPPRRWPQKPVYRIDDNHSEAKAFLVREDYFFVPRLYEKQAFPEGMVAKIKAGDAALLVFGYVQYIDAFDQPHQAGYGRWYDFRRDKPKAGLTPEQWQKRSNLAFIQSEEYNYDRPNQQGV